MQILLVSSKHGGAEIRKFSSQKSSRTLQKLKCHAWFLGSNSYTLSRHNVPRKSFSENWTLGQKIPVLQCFVLKKHKTFILGTLEQSFLSAFLAVSWSILGQCQGKNCNADANHCVLFIFDQIVTGILARRLGP